MKYKYWIFTAFTLVLALALVFIKGFEGWYLFFAGSALLLLSNLNQRTERIELENIFYILALFFVDHNILYAIILFEIGFLLKSKIESIKHSVLSLVPMFITGLSVIGSEIYSSTLDFSVFIEIALFVRLFTLAVDTKDKVVGHRDLFFFTILLSKGWLPDTYLEYFMAAFIVYEYAINKLVITSNKKVISYLFIILLHVFGLQPFLIGLFLINLTLLSMENEKSNFEILTTVFSLALLIQYIFSKNLDTKLVIISALLFLMLDILRKCEFNKFKKTNIWKLVLTLSGALLLVI